MIFSWKLKDITNLKNNKLTSNLKDLYYIVKDITCDLIKICPYIKPEFI